MIEHIDTIVDMRRHLVMNEARMPRRSSKRCAVWNSAPIPGVAHPTRTNWMEGLDIPALVGDEGGPSMSSGWVAPER